MTWGHSHVIPIMEFVQISHATIFQSRGASERCNFNQIDIIQYVYSLVLFTKGYGFLVFNVTFNNISVISWRSVLLVGETRVPAENH